MSAQQRTSRGPSKAHGLKEHREKMALRQAKRDDKQKQQELIAFALRAGAAIMAALILASGIYVAFFADNVVFINPEDEEQLKNVSVYQCTTLPVPLDMMADMIGVLVWNAMGRRLCGG
jgi:hypothetical protein